MIRPLQFGAVYTIPRSNPEYNAYNTAQQEVRQPYFINSQACREFKLNIPAFKLFQQVLCPANPNQKLPFRFTAAKSVASLPLDLDTDVVLTNAGQPHLRVLALLERLYLSENVYVVCDEKTAFFSNKSDRTYRNFQQDPEISKIFAQSPLLQDKKATFEVLKRTHEMGDEYCAKHKVREAIMPHFLAAAYLEYIKAHPEEGKIIEIAQLKA